MDNVKQEPTPVELNSDDPWAGLDQPTVMRNKASVDSNQASVDVKEVDVDTASDSGSYLDIPAFLRRQAD